MTSEDWFQIALAISWLAFLVARGLFGGPGFASWHMFVIAERGQLDLYSDQAKQRKINHWEWMPHSFLVMNPEVLTFLLRHLRDQHGLETWGSANLDLPEAKLHVTIERSRVTEVMTQ